MGGQQNIQNLLLIAMTIAELFFPGGSKIKNGKAFYGGRPKKAEDYFREWNSVKRVRFTVFDKDCKSIYEASYHLATDDIESGYKKAMEYGQVYTSTYTF